MAQESIIIIKDDMMDCPNTEIKRPKRNIPYPINHPLSRHLLNNNEGVVESLLLLDDEDTSYENDGIVGGDGSRSSQRQQRQLQLQAI